MHGVQKADVFALRIWYVSVCYLDLLFTLKSSVLKFTVIYDTNISLDILTLRWLSCHCRTTWSVIKTPIWEASHISQRGRWGYRGKFSLDVLPPHDVIVLLSVEIPQTYCGICMLHWKLLVHYVKLPCAILSYRCWIASVIMWGIVQKAVRGSGRTISEIVPKPP